MAAGSHFGCPKITLYRISYHFRSIPQFLFCEIFLQNGCLRPIWMSENNFWSNFWPFQINTKLFFFTKWPSAPILDVRNSLSIAFMAISDRYTTSIILNLFDKMAAVGHFGCQKFTFDHISGYFRSMQKLFYIFFYKITFDRISSHFRAIRNIFVWNILQNDRRRPFVMSEIHLRSHFWPFQIDMKL